MITGHFATDQTGPNRSNRRARAGFEFFAVYGPNNMIGRKTTIDLRAITSAQLVELMTDTRLAWETFPIEPSADPEMSENLAHQMTVTVAAAHAEHLARSRGDRHAYPDELPAAETHLATVVAGLRSIHSTWVAIPAA